MLLRLGLREIIAAFAGVVVTLRIFGHIDRPIFLWPVSGALLALLLSDNPHPRRKRLAPYLAGPAGVLAGGIAVGLSWQFATILAALTCLDLIVTGALLSSSIASFNDLKKQPVVLRFVLATVLSPSITGILIAFPLSRTLHLHLAMVALTAASANAIGIALLIPSVLLARSWMRSRHWRLFPVGRRTALAALVFFVVAGCVFWQTTHPFLFIIFPPMVFLLFEVDLEGAVLVTLALTFIAWFATAHGHGPICLSKQNSAQVRLISLQSFVWISVVTALPVGAILNQRKTAESHSRSSESINQVLLQYASEVFVLSSLDGTHRHVSSGIQALTGWTALEYLALERMLTVHPDDRLRAAELIAEVGRGAENRFRYRILQKNRGWKWVEASVRPYGDEVVDGYVGILRDISDLVENEEQWNDERRQFAQEQKRLEQAEQATQLQLKMRDDFLSNVSHELRSPLTSIYSFSTIIADGLAGDVNPAQAEYLTIILKNVAQLQSMIEDLLTVTQAKEGKLTINLQPVRVSTSIADVVRNFQATAAARNIRLEAIDSNVQLTAIADPVRLHQVLTILVDNALKFTPEHGTIEVSVADTSANFILTRIKDTGCGIAQDKWTRIFEKLYQITQDDHVDTNKAGRGGLGLGLHIAKNLIDRQGGQIWVTSELNKGSVFHFTLPTFRERRNRTTSGRTIPRRTIPGRTSPDAAYQSDTTS